MHEYHLFVVYLLKHSGNPSKLFVKDLYNHDVYLLSKEQAEKERINVKSSKYDDHSYLVPSVRRITKFKQLQVSEMEREAAFALFNKSTLVKSIVHFDTTGRSSIDRKWPSLILKFSGGIEYRLWPIFLLLKTESK